MLATLTRFRSLKPLDPAHARAVANWRAQRSSTRARANLEIISVRRGSSDTSPAEIGATVRSILTTLHRQGLLDDLSEDDRERVEDGARAYAEGQLNTIDWVRFLRDVKRLQAPLSAFTTPRSPPRDFGLDPE